MSTLDALERELVGQRMRSEFIHAEPGDSLLQAVQMMQLARIRHLPVLDDRWLVGLLSHRDALESLALREGEVEGRALLHRIPLSRVMHTAVHSIGPEARLAEAAQAMLRYKVGCLPVVVASDARAQMVGLTTESDLLEAAYLSCRVAEAVGAR